MLHMYVRAPFLLRTYEATRAFARKTTLPIPRAHCEGSCRHLRSEPYLWVMVVVVVVYGTTHVRTYERTYTYAGSKPPTFVLGPEFIR